MRRLRNGRILDLVLFSNRPTDGGSSLCSSIGCRYVRRDTRKKVARLTGALIINWGNTNNPSWLGGSNSVLLNPPDSVANAISKVTTYAKLREASVPTLTTTDDAEVARSWVGEGCTVLARRDGLSSGAGITIIEKGSVWPSTNADFFAKYFPKTHEYRAHVFKGRVIDITQKKRTQDVESGRTVYQRVVRSLDNGWIHAHDGIHLPSDARDRIYNAAVAAVAALGLDFGAVDILAKYSTKHPETLKEFAVCEVNTAPGLTNQSTLDAYKNAIMQEYERTKQERFVPRRKKVRKMVRVLITTRKGNRVYRERPRWVYE